MSDHTNRVVEIKKESAEESSRFLDYLDPMAVLSSREKILKAIKERALSRRKSFLSRAAFVSQDRALDPLIVDAFWGGSDHQVRPRDMAGLKQLMSPKKKISSPLSFGSDSGSRFFGSDTGASGAAEGNSVDPVVSVDLKKSPEEKLRKIRPEITRIQTDFGSSFGSDEKYPKLSATSVSTSAEGLFSPAPNTRTIPAKLATAASSPPPSVQFMRRSSLTAAPLQLVRDAKKEGLMSGTYTPPPTPASASSESAMTAVRLMRSPSVGSLAQASFQSLAPSRLQGLRGRVEEVIHAASLGASPGQDSVLINAEQLKKKGEALALALAARSEPSSADYLDWMLTKYEQPEVFLREARGLLLQQEVAQKRVEILEEFICWCSDMSAAANSLDFNGVTRFLQKSISSLEAELVFSPEVYESLYSGSDLNGTGENFDVIPGLVRQAREDLIKEFRSLFCSSEGIYLAQDMHFRAQDILAMPAAAYYESLLSKFYVEAKDKLEAVNKAWIFNDESPAAKVAEQTELHKRMASELAVLAPQLGVDISERDLLELHRFAIDDKTTEALPSKLRALSQEPLDSPGIIERAVSAHELGSPSLSEIFSPREAFDELDISLNLDADTADTSASSQAISLSPARSPARSPAQSAASSDHDAAEEKVSGRSLLKIAVDSGNYRAAFIIRAHGADFVQDSQGEFPRLHQIRISRELIRNALQDYDSDHDNLLRMQNYRELEALLATGREIQMGDLMKILLCNEGEMTARSMKTLLAVYLKIPGISLNESQNPSTEKMKEMIGNWCAQMIYLKMGIPVSGFSESKTLLELLIKSALKDLNQRENVVVLNNLFSSAGFKALSSGAHTDQNLARNLKEKFAAYLPQNIGKTAPKKEVLTNSRKILDQVLKSYKENHRFLNFKTNYRRAFNLRKSEKTASENLPLGDLMAIFYSKSGEFSEHSFKQLLARDLGIPGFGVSDFEVPENQSRAEALDLINQWAHGALIEQILGKDHHFPRSQLFLDLMIKKALAYLDQPNGLNKARDILNALGALDTLDFRAVGYENSTLTDQKICQFLQSQLNIKPDLKAQDVPQPALARAFSQPRNIFGKDSSAAKDVLTQSQRILETVSAAAA